MTEMSQVIWAARKWGYSTDPARDFDDAVQDARVGLLTSTAGTKWNRMAAGIKSGWMCWERQRINNVIELREADIAVQPTPTLSLLFIFDTRTERIMRLRYEGRLEFKEIADCLGIHVNWVSRLHKRAIETLRGMLCSSD